MDNKKILKENKRILDLMNLSEAAETVGGIQQLIYNPLGYGYNKGKLKPGFKVSNHDNHLHIGFKNRDVAIKIMDKSLSMGLRTSENPYTFGKKNGDPTGKIERVHVSNSAHYSNFPGSPTVGMGVDISGNSGKIKELVRWIESEFGGGKYKDDPSYNMEFPDESSTESSSSSSSSSTSGSQSTTGDTFIKAILSPYMSALGLNEQFLNPTSSTRKIKLDSKRVDFPAQSGGRVYSPYEGVVSKVSNSDCNGTVEIKINLDKEYYIVVCNVDPKQNVGDNVSAGEIIGHAKGDSIQLEVKDSGGKKYKLSQFFKDKKTDNEKDKKLKGDDVKPFELSKAHLSIMRAPLDIAKYVVSGVYNNIKSQNSRASSRDEISENINLKEELIRIKKLMN